MVLVLPFRRVAPAVVVRAARRIADVRGEDRVDRRELLVGGALRVERRAEDRRRSVDREPVAHRPQRVGVVASIELDGVPRSVVRLDQVAIGEIQPVEETVIFIWSGVLYECEKLSCIACRACPIRT